METDDKRWAQVVKEAREDAAEADAKDEAIANRTYNYRESKEYLDLKKDMSENEKA